VIIIQIIFVAWAVVIVLAALAVVASWLTSRITDRSLERHADRAMEIVRDDWREWEREVAQ
jgi:uncharacterized membrane protein